MEEGSPREGVCFTAGPKGAPFGAGAVHAWLAADRAAPAIAAGISAGTLNAAAVQRCYRELLAATGSQDEREVARWKWFRRYLETLADDPLEIFWKAIPDPVDLAADKPPVRDNSAPASLKSHEAAARRHYHILTNLGVWLSTLPVRVRSVASQIVFNVRLKERYGVRSLARLGWLWSRLQIAAGIFWHVLTRPGFFFEHWFVYRPSGRKTPFYLRMPRPLMGWAVWLLSIAVALSLPVYAAFAIALATGRTADLWNLLLGNAVAVRALALASSTLVLLAGLVAYFARSVEADRSLAWGLAKFLCAKLDISLGLLHPYHLRRQLYELFREDSAGGGDSGPKVGSEPVHLLLACAALQRTCQISAEPSDDLIDALVAALAVPGIFPPFYDRANEWDLIDGVAIRQNPLPSLFTFLHRNPAVGRGMQAPGRKPTIHVVYNVPIEPYDPKRGEPEEQPDIVEAILAGVELQKRRDTRQEVVQTNFRSDLRRCLDAVGAPAADGGGAQPAGDPFRIFADEIAPPRDLVFANYWSPTRKEILEAAALGCQATLETLYCDEILSDGGGMVRCRGLLARLAPQRVRYFSREGPGLPEVCAACSGNLQYRSPGRTEEPPAGVVPSFGGQSADLEEFRHLRDDGPRLVFVASGGVFRGAFHIGCIGALHAVGLRPDLVVGASVGALMGGALSAITVLEHKEATALLHDLASVFLHVDQQVALTRTLKNALKQLGVRGRNIRLAPSEIRRMIAKGTRADPGYAAAGAPPALIDAISSLFLIPHEKTAAIASQFVAGHFSEAVNQFLNQVRTETLPSLDVRYALMGISLLEDVARRLLGAPDIALDRVQPYHGGDHRVSFFATTSYLNRRMPLLLGRDFLSSGPAYDFVYAALSSSAFPAIFSARRESEVIPGRGRADVFFADGGIFDNLPFLPAMEILGEVQSRGRTGTIAAGEPIPERLIGEVLAGLCRRVAAPDVFIAAALDADPLDDRTGKAHLEFDTFIRIYKHAKTLNLNGKIAAFSEASRQIHVDLQNLAQRADGLAEWLRREPDGALRERSLRILDRAIDASILKIAPVNACHVNGTFAFCRAVGMDPKVIRRSIADGCYQTLKRLAEDAAKPGFERLQEVRGLQPAAGSQAGECAWFRWDGAPLHCPFSTAVGKRQDPDVMLIRIACGDDPDHRPAPQAQGKGGSGVAGDVEQQAENDHRYQGEACVKQDAAGQR